MAESNTSRQVRLWQTQQFINLREHDSDLRRTLKEEENKIIKERVRLTEFYKRKDNLIKELEKNQLAYIDLLEEVFNTKNSEWNKAYRKKYQPK